MTSTEIKRFFKIFSIILGTISFALFVPPFGVGLLALQFGEQSWYYSQSGVSLLENGIWYVWEEGFSIAMGTYLIFCMTILLTLLIIKKKQVNPI